MNVDAGAETRIPQTRIPETRTPERRTPERRTPKRRTPVSYQLTGSALPSSYPAADCRPTCARSWNSGTDDAPA
ncbi:hypothetical protein RS84_03443 [Microbacterium hydrocarbonoxydans]|uniref:Uncharacterized protein n=1 Tax=Microbacterium hydrocarbonoxydans TaxID=273678 RepID=A0A0M2HQP9_9MICO|nr:hypothetical protein RS84_03443 [Microbacterium hydrocarbonoxydans]